MKEIVLATHNAGKLKEIQHALNHFPIQLHLLDEYSLEAPPETGVTFVENALIKARFACEHTGLPALAEDSGLIVDALQGKPGIISARFAGENANDSSNIQKVLMLLKDTPKPARTAHFKCVMVLLKHVDDPSPLICQGSWEGEILDAPLGENGFGYDPIFFIPTLKRSAAELTIGEKSILSHRAHALKELKKALGFVLTLI